MNLKFLSLLLLLIGSQYIKSQNYNDLPLSDKIRIKENKNPQYSAHKLGQGDVPVIQSSPEQDCNSAIPVCQNVYNTSASYSGVGANDEIPSNSSCLGSNEKNSVWYTFTTSSSGNLAFNITPNSMSDDYDFALYDITGNNCSGIASGAIAPVRCNFSATSGVTGLSSSGSNASEPASGSNQSTVLATTPGKTYVLVISNYSSSQSGYTLDFSPGTASIFDNIPPTIAGVTAPCGSSAITFNASEQIKCNSIAANGSDFTVTGTGGPYIITAATGVNCGVNTAQVNLSISPALNGAGPWTVAVNTGTDGNTLIDACGNAMAAQSQTFTTTPPVATISGPSSICEGSPLALTASSASSYTWTGASVPAGQQNQQTISMASLAPGTYNFNLTVSNGSCGNSSTNKSVTVNDAPNANFSVSPSLTVCAGTAVTFNNTTVLPCSTGGAGLNQCTCGTFLCNPTPVGGTFASYLWTFGDGGTDFYIFGSGNLNPTHTYASPGTYNVNLTASTTLGAGCSNSKNVTITVLPSAASLTVSPSVTICPGQSATLTVTGGSNYTWTPSGTLSSTSGSTTVASPASTTVYSVSAPGCSGSQTKTVQVTVNGTPPNIGAISGTSLVCSNQTNVTYSVTNVASTNYTWSVPSGASITSTPTNSNIITVSFGASAGTVSVTASSACGTASADITVNLSPGLTLTITPDNFTICNGGNTTLTANGATNYTWSPSGSLSSSTGSSVNANPVSTTTYTIQGATGTCTGVATATVNVAANLTLTVTPNNPVICPAGQANLTASGATSYTWSNGATLNTTSGSSVIASPIVTTIYTVTGSSGSCTGVGTATVTVDNTNCNTGTCNVAQIRAALTAAGNIELLGMNNPCSLYFINPQFMTGPNAQAYAQTFGANLISIQSATENSNLMNALANQGYSGQVVWIGFTDAASEGNFVWYDGSPINYTNWNVVEPNNAGGNENCTQIYPDGTWNDLNCSGYNSLSVIEVNLCPQVSITNVPVHCTNTIVNLNASTLLGSPNYTYTWTQSGTETFTNTSTPGNTDQISVTSIGANTFTVTSVDRYSCQQSTSINLMVDPSPTISVNAASFCSGQQTATLTANGAISYTWSPSNGLSSTNGNMVVANPSVSTIYTIQGTSATGCVGTTTTSVNVSYPPNVYIIQKNSLCDTSILNWINVTSVSPTLAQGSLPSGLTVSATHSNGGMSTTPSMFGGGNFPVTYSVPISSTTIRNDLGGTFNFCFNQPIINPQIAFSSIGNSSLPITINTSVPYQVIWAGINMNYVTPTSMIGTEGYTIIRFPGTHTCVSIDYIGDETYCNLAFGVMDADCQGRPICPGDPLELIANGATSYTWNNGATTSTITPTASVTTTYSVSAMNVNGCINTASTTVQVNPTPTLTVNSSTICLGQQTATLTANGANTYTWSPSATLSSSTGSVVNGTPSSTQSYTVTGSDINGCVSDTTTTITVNPLPIISVNTATICLGQQTATLLANGASNYSWTPFASLSSSTGSSVTGTPVTTTDYTITGQDLNGCLNTGTTTITVVNIPTITVSSNATICPLSNTVLVAGGATNYTWVPSTSLNNTNTATVTANPGSSITYTVGGIDNNGCVNANTVQVTVAANPTITAASNATICPAGSTSLTASGGISYTWTPSGSLNSANGSSVTSTPASSTTYTVSGESSDGCVSTNTVDVYVANNPTVTISPNATVCPLETTTLTANGAFSYSWTPNTYLNNDNTTSVTSTPSASITYSVTGTTINGCTNTNTVNVTVSNTVVVTASAANPTICPGGTATITASGATNYTWSPNIGLSSTSGTIVAATPASDQTYTVIGATSTCTNVTQVVITVTTNPVITVNSATICSGNSANLTASGANTYSWNPSLFLSSNTGSSVIANPPNTKTYTVTGTSQLGCRGSAGTTVEVIPMPNLIVGANPISLCPGETSTLTASGASAYTWSPSASLTNSVGASTIASPNITTTYLLIGANGRAPNLCTSTKTVEITIKPTTTVTVGKPDPICFGSYTILESHGGTIYNWLPSSGISHPNDSVITVKPSSSTIYTVSVNTPGYCASTETVEVIVNPLPYVYAGEDTTINIDETVTLHGTGDTQVGFLSPDTYPLNCNLCPTLLVQPQESTCFILKGTSALGCTNFDTVCVTIAKDWNVYIPNAFTPNNDGINDLFMPSGYAIDKINMTIFNRWGEVIFQTDPEHAGWDGKYKGVLCEQGVYVYQIEVTSMGGASMKKVGHVTLLPLKK